MATVKFLNYNGVRLPFKLGVFTMMLAQEEGGVVMGAKGLQNEDGTNLTASQYIPLLFLALEQGHRITKKPFEFEHEDMHDILNECFMDFVTAIPSFFPEAEDMLEKVTVEAGKILAEKQKKTLAKKTTKSTTRSSSGQRSQTSKSGRKK